MPPPLALSKKATPKKPAMPWSRSLATPSPNCLAADGRRRAPERPARRLPQSEEEVMRHWLSSALWFCAPFAVLLVLWAVLVPYFDVNPRLFPHLDSVAQAGLEGIQDGTLIQHIGASLLRVAVGTVLALLFAIPLGVAMGVSPAVSGFLTPPFRFFSVLAGIAWIPHRIAVVRLRLRRHHLRDLQCRVLHRDVQHAARRLDHSPAGAQRGRIARRGAMGDVDRGAAAGRASQHRHRHTHRDWALPGAG